MKYAIAALAIGASSLVVSSSAHAGWDETASASGDADSSQYHEVVVTSDGGALVLGTWRGEYRGVVADEGTSAFVEYRDADGEVAWFDALSDLDLTCVRPEAGPPDSVTQRARATEVAFFTISTCDGTHIVSADADGVIATRPAGPAVVYGYSSFAADPTGGVQVVARAEQFGPGSENLWTLYSYDDRLDIRSTTELPAALHDPRRIRFDEFDVDDGSEFRGVTNLVGPDGTGWVIGGSISPQGASELLLLEVDPSGGLADTHRIPGFGCIRPEDAVDSEVRVRALQSVDDQLWVAACGWSADQEDPQLSILALDATDGDLIGEVAPPGGDVSEFEFITNQDPMQFSPDGTLAISQDYRGPVLWEISGSLGSTRWEPLKLSTSDDDVYTALTSADPIGDHEYVAVGSTRVSNGDPSDVDDDVRRATIARRSFPTLQAVDPARLLDTRPGFTTTDAASAGIGRRPAGSVTEVQVTGRGDVPGDAGAVVVNVAAVKPSDRGFLTIYPCGDVAPVVSALNVVEGVTASNAVTSALSATGSICVYTSTATDVVIDVNGFFRSMPSFGRLDPVRLFDSRPGAVTLDGASTSVGPLAADEVARIPVRRAGVASADAVQVVVNVTAIAPTERGFVTLYDCAVTRPKVASVNFAAGETTPNQAFVNIGSTGDICAYTSVETDVAIDVTAALGSQAGMRVDQPLRFLDTRPTGTTFDDKAAGSNGTAGRLPGDDVFTFSVLRVPLDRFNRVGVINVAVVNPSSNGYLTVWPCGRLGSTTAPTASTVNYRAGQVTSNSLVIGIPSSPWLCFEATSEYDLILDLITSR